MSDEFDRYHRQMLLPGIGEAGQRRLRESTVLLLGCGALGSVAADLLARAGVGHLVIVDRDIVELTNLQRQVLFDEDDVAARLPKAEAARRRIEKINSQVQVSGIVDDIDHANIGRYAKGADLLLDGLDNFETRYLANDYAVKHGVPYIYGAAVGTMGMMLPIMPRADGQRPWETAAGGSFATPCLRCVFDAPPPSGASPTCDTAGVLGPVVAMIANLQVIEALKMLTGNYDRVSRSLLNIDAWSNEMLQLDIATVSDAGTCTCCGKRVFDYLDGRAGFAATSLCGRNAVQLRNRHEAAATDLDLVARRLRSHGPVRVNEFLLQAELQDAGAAFEITLFRDGRAIVKGTDEPDIARAIYARYIGS